MRQLSEHAAVDPGATTGTVTSWHGTVPAELAGRATATALEVARRCADPERVIDLVMAAAEQAVHPNGWAYHGFAHGHAGLALVQVLAAEAAAEQADRHAALAAAFTYIREAVAGTAGTPLTEPGVLSGTSGLALGLAACVRAEPRFGPSLDRLHEQLAAQVLDLPLPRVEREVSDVDYDMVSGAAGILSYLCGIADPGPAVRAAAEHLVDYLVWLGAPPRDLTLTRRWLITPDLCRSDRDYPNGHLNVGLAHGIPGPLAALATAWLAGYQRPGQETALRLTLGWVQALRRTDEHGPVWPSEVPIDDTGAETRPSQPADQIAWCYGTAGVAVALLPVAEALGDDSLRALAVASFEAVLGRFAEHPVQSPTFCHGIAGVLVLCLEFAAHGSALAADWTPRLLELLLAQADPELPVLFRDQEKPGVFVDSPSLLSGSAGIALALLAATAPRRPSWFRAFLTR
ncbi:lanthionine synthetase C family protein [Crossiella sp. CA198]|uniref:lanthionine synthetase C family protein n=1 Tax=Crossiella sp. CA198 TaxID=3455607 RepID=UPI003F8D6A9E